MIKEDPGRSLVDRDRSHSYSYGHQADGSSVSGNCRKHKKLRPWSQRLLVPPELSPAHYQYEEIRENVLKELRHLIFHLAKPMPEKKIFSQTLKLAREIDPDAKLYDTERPCWTSTVDVIVSDTKFATRVGAHVVKTQPGTYNGCDRGVARCLHRAVSMGLHTRAAVPHGLRTPFGTIVRGKLRSDEYIAALIDLEVKLWHPKSFPQSDGFHIEAPPFSDQVTICLHVPWHQKDVMLRSDTRATVPMQYRMVTTDDINEVKVKEEENVEIDIDEGYTGRELGNSTLKLENECDNDEDMSSNKRPAAITPVKDNKYGSKYNESQADILSMNKWLNRTPRQPRPLRRFVEGGPPSHLISGNRNHSSSRPVVRRDGHDSFITVRKMRDQEWGPDSRDPRVKNLKRTQKTLNKTNNNNISSSSRGLIRSKNALEPHGNWHSGEGWNNLQGGVGY